MNVIYFNPDEMRADVLGCYGHPLARTPAFDRLAAEGVRFDQCHVQHTVCTPSRCSFMTGWYPHTRGHRTLWHCLRPDEPNTLKYLKRAGYDVHWIGKNDLLAPQSFAESVTRVHAVTGQLGRSEDLFAPEQPGFMSFLRGPMDGHNHDWHGATEAVRFLESRRPGDRPFFLFLAFGFPHCPYTCPEPYYSMYDPDDLPPLRPAELPGKPDFHQAIRRYRRLDELDEGVFRKIMAVYLGMVSYVDAMFARVLEALDRTGLADDTAVVFFSDHGDWAGDYGLVEKWPSGLDDCLTRIPMVVRTPGCAAGHVVREPVECFDIMPTTLELAGVACEHVHHARSMMPQLRGAPGDAGRAVFAEGGYDPHEPHCFEGKNIAGDIGSNPKGIYWPKGLQQQQRPETVRCATMIRTASGKLIRRPGGQHELYDLLADPRELHNLWDDPRAAGLRAELTERMLDWYVHTADVVPTDADPRGFPPGLPR